MRALVFGAPMALEDLPDRALRGPDWAVLRTRLCGICGSDAKQVRLEGDADDAMTAFISFPQVLGHEVVAAVELVPVPDDVPDEVAVVRSGRVDLDGLLTHTFPLSRWDEAFAALADQGTTGAIKVALDLRR